ncbi:MAG: hypothetical protein EOP06_06845, partial [Proteobacteria bacterium]
MSEAALDLRELFYLGRYADLLRASVDAHQWRSKLEEIPYVIGALSFSSRMEEAELLARSLNQSGNVSEVIQARFFLGIGHTRLSDYKAATLHFAANLRLAQERRNVGLDIFYIFQGISFYR